MAVITPVGKIDFDWSPKDPEKVVKTASTSENPSQKGDNDEAETHYSSSRDKLYQVARQVVGQIGDTEIEQEEDVEEFSDSEETPQLVEDVNESEEVSEEAKADGDAEDVQEAVADLVEKSEKADDVAEKVQDAVEKVEDAVGEVKEVVGVPEEVEIDISDETDEIDETPEDVEEVVELSDEEDDVSEEDVSEDALLEIDVVEDEEDEEGGEDIVQESDEIEEESCSKALANKKKNLKRKAGVNDFVKTSKISPTTRKKILKFWRDDLGYAADYAKLMATDFDK